MKGMSNSIRVLLLVCLVLAAERQFLTPIAQTLLLEKTGSLDLGGDGIANPGDVINYAFKVTNASGTPTISDISVTDPMISPITCPSGNPIPVLPVGAMQTCSGTYVITQADVDAGVKNNTAQAAGQDSLGNPVSAQDSHSEPIAPIPVTLMRFEIE